MNRFLTVALVILAIVMLPFSAMAQEAGRACDKSVSIQQAPGSTTIIQSVPGTQITICGFLISSLATTGVTAQFSSSGVNLTGAMVMRDSSPVVYDLPIPVPYEQSVTLTTAGGSASGVVSYRQ